MLYKANLVFRLRVPLLKKINTNAVLIYKQYQLLEIKVSE